jgi:hypothetical protein
MINLGILKVKSLEQVPPFFYPVRKNAPIPCSGVIFQINSGGV